MASRSKKKTTFAKLKREDKVRESYTQKLWMGLKRMAAYLPG
jgi:hypothetical protein